jgi:hypothetical protein
VLAGSGASLRDAFTVPGSQLGLLVGTRDDERFDTQLGLARDHSGVTDLGRAAARSVRGDITAYATQLLAAQGPYAPGSMRAARQALAQSLAEQLTAPEHREGSPERAEALQWGEFLTAGLYVHYLLTAEEPRQNPEEAAALGRAVPRDLPALLELDLQRHSEQRFLRPVLTALAAAAPRPARERPAPTGRRRWPARRPSGTHRCCCRSSRWSRTSP